MKGYIVPLRLATLIVSTRKKSLIYREKYKTLKANFSSYMYTVTVTQSSFSDVTFSNQIKT